MYKSTIILDLHTNNQYSTKTRTDVVKKAINHQKEADHQLGSRNTEDLNASLSFTFMYMHVIVLGCIS